MRLAYIVKNREIPDVDVIVNLITITRMEK
jgi:hypothetical protein